MADINTPRPSILASAVLAIVPVAIALLLGQWATFPNLPWHAGLIKPSFNPPNWVFGPVWTTLYALMAFATWRILRLPSSPARRTALNLFYAQLALNAAWSWMFFAGHSPSLGLINIVPQFLLILATINAFRPLDRYATSALVPLAAWVAFAGALNYSIWSLN
jgi:tryptophan-rich sensory protein